MFALRFDPYLNQLAQPMVQDMAKSWGFRGKAAKSECMAAITRGLKDPKQIQQLIAGLKPYERLALELTKAQGGKISVRTVIITAALLGLEQPDLKNRFGNEEIAYAHELIRSGIFIATHSTDAYYGYGLNFEQLISDERILEQVGAPNFPTLNLKETAAPKISAYRRPASVVLTILGFMQAVSGLGGLKLTKSGAPQVNSLRKLTKAQRWEEDGTEIDGFWFPQPTIALTAASVYSGMLTTNADETQLALAAPIEAFANRPYPVQVSQLLVGLSVTGEWAEWTPSSFYDASSYIEARQVLLLVLKLLPLDKSTWFSLDDLEKFLFDRIGDRFSLTGFIPSQFRSVDVDPEESAKRWRDRQRKEWQQREKHWFRYALSTWLYLLGIVELGWNSRSEFSNQNEAIVSFRVTELGQMILHPEVAASFVEQAAQPAWIVQPNFELLVYVDEVAPSQMIFLDRYADRLDIQQHTAHYRLTRESVYRGLECGGSLEEFLTALRTGAKVPVPQNVEIDLQQWGGLREQITLRRETQMIEFADYQAMQTAMNQGVKGKILGDRFLLIDKVTPEIESLIKQKIRYDQPLVRCLKIGETGEVTQTKSVHDLLLETQLQQWMEKGANKTWALTQASVAKAAKAGNKASDILDFLEARRTDELPPLLKVALTAWAGRPPTLEMAEVIVLRCTNWEVFDAIARSEFLRSRFVARLSPDLLLVDRSQLKKLKQDLEWLGIQPLEQLRID